LQTFRKLLNEATERLSKASEATLLREILKQEYQIPAETVDSMELQPITKVSTVRQADIEEAEKWLTKKKKIK